MNNEKETKPIDLVSIVKTLWQQRRKYYYVLPAALIGTYLFTLCIPRYYECKVSLAPESGGVSVSGSLTSLASSFGLGSSLAKMNSQDAIYSEIYPDVIGSKNFIAELMPVEVETKDGDIKTNYYQYLRDKQKAAWWDIVIGTVKNWIKPPKADTYNGNEKISVFSLTKLQSDIFNAVKGKISCTVDKKTDIVSITVNDQDPLVCATIADATCKKLQSFIVDYRTNKARIDYEYYEKLCEESRAIYDQSVKAYVECADANRNAVLVSYTTRISALEDEMQANFEIYTAMKNQKQAAAAKLQEATPAFTVIESASTPIKPAGPKRLIISVAMMVLAFFVLTGWIFIKDKSTFVG